MFQRFQKGFNLDFLDNKIAEEQAKQQQHQSSSTSQRARRGTGRTDSPGRRATASRPKAPTGPATKGPDPDEFSIGDDGSDISRVATPLPVKDDGEKPTEEKDGGEKQDEKDKGKETADDDEALPLEVRQKLAKLETLTTRYQDLLRNYRTAHAHVSAIEPFEATLREHTPLTSISDPGALVEFLNQRSMQSEMVMEELKRLSGENRDVAKERDELKVKLEEAERKAKEAFDEVTGFKKQRDEAQKAMPEPSGKEAGGDDLFSYDAEVTSAGAEREKEREEELKNLEQEVKEQKEYINELSTENATLRQDLDMVRLDLSAMQNKIRIKENQIKEQESELVTVKKQLHDSDGARDKSTRGEGEFTAPPAQESSQASEVSVRQRDNKRMETLQKLVDTLKDQVNQADNSKKLTDGQVNDLQFEIKRLEAEVHSSENIISRLRGHEAEAESLKRRLTAAEQDRDQAQRLAETKKGHEAAVASLRGQLKRAEKDRDTAYQMIIDCGKCGASPNNSDETATEASGSTPGSKSRRDSDASKTSTQPTDLNVAPSVSSTPSLDNGDFLSPVDSKKKNKKKKKAKSTKTAQEDIGSEDAGAAEKSDDIMVEALIRDPSKAQEILEKYKAKFGDTPVFPILTKIVEHLRTTNESLEEERMGILKTQQDAIEEQAQNIQTIRERDLEILTLKLNIEQRTAVSDDTLAMTKQVEMLEKEVAKLKVSISEKDDEIHKLQARLRGEAELNEAIEALREERDDLQESLLDVGKRATDAAYDLQLAREANEKLQAKFDELQEESDGLRRKLRDAETQQEELTTRCDTLGAELSESKENRASVEDLKAAKEQLEAVQREKESLQLAKDACEKQIEELEAQRNTSGIESDAQHKSMTADLSKFKSRAAELEKELAAANQLAQTRFKDLNDLRGLYNKVQPELKKLRDDASELKTYKGELEESRVSIRKLEAKEKTLRAEIANFKAQTTSKDTELSSFKEKAKIHEERNAALEDTCDRARKDLERSESTRDGAIEARDRATRSLAKLEEEMKASQAKLDALDKQVKKFSAEASGLRDELQLKTAQQQSAQSLMDSMSDQTRELATQMKEVRERNESLEDELSDAHRLLSERSREGETMRRLLADVEGRAETKVKELREKMDLVVEERDRAEEGASSMGRRRAREIDDLKTKLRDAERDAKRATEAREDAEKREADYKSRLEDLERRANQAQTEVSEVRTAMVQLRDALDQAERQSREAEREKSELRQTLEDRDARLAKLQKSSKSMAEELRNLQTAHKASQGGSSQSSRVTSPMRNAAPGAPTGGSNPPSKGEVDFVYLKTVLLQFLEQKDKKHQMQLVPVLAMLLHFDRQDEQKWTAAISGR